MVDRPVVGDSVCLVIHPQPGTARRAGALEGEARLAGEARRLLMPGEMGEAFKVMALTRNFEEALAGFTLQDLTRSL